MNMNEPPSLLRNDYAGGNGWLERDGSRARARTAPGIGATVLVTAGGRTQARAVLSQSSYYSHDDLRLHFGLGRGHASSASRCAGRAGASMWSSRRRGARVIRDPRRSIDALMCGWRTVVTQLLPKSASTFNARIYDSLASTNSLKSLK